MPELAPDRQALIYKEKFTLLLFKAVQITQHLDKLILQDV